MYERSWKDAKIPAWVSESIDRDLMAFKITAALSWPTESRPEPIPFFWGEYDRLLGEPMEGTFWVMGRYVEPVEIRIQDGSVGQKWKSWVFRSGGGQWTTSVPRGRLFSCERDARLELLWRECESSAKTLNSIREKLYS